ncbi:hypothetical protein DL767_002098 [Monosporascus sp. MG133]|nr:hypothetical protein DL767_002098 [Monosporascus sp. MG133]
MSDSILDSADYIGQENGIAHAAGSEFVQQHGRYPKEMAIRDVCYVEVTEILPQYKKRWEGHLPEERPAQPRRSLVSDLPMRYTMFPKTEGNSQFEHTERCVVMAHSRQD